MPKAKLKTYTTPKKKVKAANKPPETADEYLAAGVDLEEAGEKWRAGDAAKASRFFVRAIESYDEGLSLFPASFDMAYNKARIQYDITQRPALLAQASASLQQLLEQALQSHRQALALDQQNADVMFNTGQVLASLADEIDDDPLSIAYLEEALQLFEQCLLKQEELFAESASLLNPDNETLDETEQDGGVPLNDESNAPADSDSSHEDMQWASVVEPTTRSSLLETCVAALDALAALYALLPKDGHQIKSKLDHLGEIWSQKLEGNTNDNQDVTILDEARCSNLKCQAASVEATYRLGELDIASYGRRLNELADLGRKNMLETSTFLCACADINIAFAAAAANKPDAASARWTKLTKALDFLEQAVKIAEQKDAASIHVGRGDVELLRFSLCLEGNLPDNISNEKVQARLLKNAETYYRGAATTAQSTTDLHETWTAATIKVTISSCIGNGSNDTIPQLRKQGIADASIKRILLEIIEESLLPVALLQQRKII